jgi:quercetin dioxygenase-like cupin family protein
LQRIYLTLISALAIAVTAAVVVGARARVAAQSTPKNSQSAGSPQAMILQEEDGDHLIHSSGPLTGVPLTIKVDGQFGGSQDLFVFTETLSKGMTIPFHKHDNAEEILIFEEGGATVIVGDKRSVAGARSIVFIPRETWISASNSGDKDIHLVSVFSRHGFEQYLRAISVKPGEPMKPINPDDLPGLRALGHAMYWDTSKGPYPPGVAHP